MAAVPDDLANADLIRSVLRNARGEMQNVRQNIDRMRREISGPVGVVNFVFQYMPDGRPVSWPPGFCDELRDAAAAHGWPVFDPDRLVARYGVETSLRPDLRHYRDDFLPTVARHIKEFIVHVARLDDTAAVG